MSLDTAALQRRNDVRWHDMKFARSPLDFDERGKIAYKNRWRYIEIIKRLQALGSNMPYEAWVFIAAIHERESSMNFHTHLGQGDPLTNKAGVPIKTVHVPANRGPFPDPKNPGRLADDAFEQAAVDALWYCAPYAARKNKDWSISGMLTYLELYNGRGYALRGLPSPYLWAGTNEYTKGKFIADGVFNSEARDMQLGVAGLLKRLDLMDPQINFAGLPEVDAPSVVTALPEGRVPVRGLHDAVWVQWALNELGHEPPLDIDGVLGSESRSAIREYQMRNRLKNVDGKAGTVETIPSIIRALSYARKPEFPENALKPDREHA